MTTSTLSSTPTLDPSARPLIEPLIEGTLGSDELVLISGPGDAEDSTPALDWAVSVATGLPWQGRPASRGSVLYIARKAAKQVGARVSAWKKLSDVKIGHDDLLVLSILGQIVDPVPLEEIVALVAEESYDLVVIDTLDATAWGLDMNSYHDVGVLIDAANRIRQSMDGGTVLIVHRTGKDGVTGRGSVALEAAVDTSYVTDGMSGVWLSPKGTHPASILV